MKTFKVTKEIQFDYGHRIPDHKSKCRNVHGHRGRVEVEVVGPLNTEGSDNGMVLDFGDIKKALTEHVHDVFDHRCLLYAGDPLWNSIHNAFYTEDRGSTAYGPLCYIGNFGLVVVVTFIPTAENLAKAIFDALSSALNRTVHVPYKSVVEVTAVRFWETPTSYATFTNTTYERE